VVEEQPTLGVEAEQLRPGVPLVRVRGRLDLPAADSLRLVVDKVLDDRPWAVVLDMSALVEMGGGAVQPLVELAYHAGKTDIGLYLVTAGGAIDHVLGNGQTEGLFDIHHSLESAERALGSTKS
jgi:anti-anti-sigma factor